MANFFSQLVEQAAEIGKLQLVLQQTMCAHEQALLEQQHMNEAKLAFVLRQLNEQTATPGAAAGAPASDELKTLSKELYFYKQRSRALKKQLDALQNTAGAVPATELLGAAGGAQLRRTETAAQNAAVRQQQQQQFGAHSRNQDMTNDSGSDDAADVVDEKHDAAAGTKHSQTLGPVPVRSLSVVPDKVSFFRLVTSSYFFVFPFLFIQTLYLYS